MGSPVIKISQPGVNAQTANSSQLLFTTQYPFSKFDATKPQSFQTIDLLFNAEPTNPTTINGTSNTLIYSFAHGYNYIPSIWMMWQNSAPAFPAPQNLTSTTTFYSFGDDTAGIFTLQNFSPSSSVYQSTSPLASVTVLYNGNPYYCSDATLYAKVDSSTVYLYLLKVNYVTFTVSPTYFPTNILNTRISVRIYVFCEPALGNS